MRSRLIAVTAVIILLPVLVLGLLDYARGDHSATDSIITGALGVPLAVWLFIAALRSARPDKQ
ncbi:hypothetical protein [Actinomadura luteofluorescens]|uniref:hypothetical protein n=1 Tax=Actinomadura luteofluorescens TaxID=46163 RepID=UPI003D8B3B80